MRSMTTEWLFSLCITMSVFGGDGLAQTEPATVDALQVEAARLYAAEARKLNLPGPAASAGDSESEAQRLAAWVADIEKTRRDYEERQKPVILRRGRWQSWPDGEEMLRARQGNPAAFAREDGVSLAGLEAERKLRSLEQGDSYFEELLRAMSGALAAGRTLTNVETVRLSEAARKDLLVRLPVQVGERLSFASVCRLADVVKGFDADLAVELLLVKDGGVTVTVSAPENAGR